MIKRIPYSSLGHADHGWLDARHHFSFAQYWNPERVEFGSLRVINDDRIAAGSGFGRHPHDNMEIITYVRQGALTHKDSLGNEGKTEAGNVQVMSAGTGVSHSEHNLEHEDTRLYQIWITPSKENVEPRWETAAFPQTKITSDPLPLLVSGRPEDEGKGALFIHQDAAIYGGKIAGGVTLEHSIKHKAYVLASSGAFQINDTEMHPGDGAEIRGEKIMRIVTHETAEILIIDIP